LRVIETLMACLASLRLLRFCFSYDPAGRTYVFNLAKVVAVVMLASVACFVVFLVFVGLASATLSMARVKQRVQHGVAVGLGEGGEDHKGIFLSF